LKYDRR
jgi:centrin-1